MLLLSGKIIREAIEHLTDTERQNVLILDDSVFSRSRSKKLELLTKLYYDAMVAHVEIVFANYKFLAVEQRENMDMRSLGELFYLSVDELPDIQYIDALD